MMLYKNIRLTKELKKIEFISFGEADVPYEEMCRQVELTKDEVMQEVSQFIGTLEESYSDLVEGVTARIPELLKSMIGQILLGVELDRDQIQKMVDAMIHEHGNTDEKLKIVLSSSDYGKFVTDMLKGRYPKVEFVQEDGLRSGDCLLESKFGIIDGRIDTKINQLSEELVH